MRGSSPSLILIGAPLLLAAFLLGFAGELAHRLAPSSEALSAFSARLHTVPLILPGLGLCAAVGLIWAMRSWFRGGDRQWGWIARLLAGGFTFATALGGVGLVLNRLDDPGGLARGIGGTLLGVAGFFGLMGGLALLLVRLTTPRKVPDRHP